MGLYYNGTSLQTASIITKDIDHLSAPDQELSMFAVAHANRSSITNAEYQKKAISLSGMLIGTSLTNMESLRDTFLGIFVGYDQNLDIDWASSTRRYIVSPQSVMVDRPNGLLFANFQVSLICSLPFGTDTTATTLLSNSGNTGASNAYSVTFTGTAPYQVPVITITFSAANMNGFATRTVSIGNNTTGQQLNVTRYWNATDVLVVNSATNVVTVNGTPVDYSGAFPEFGTSSQSITYSDNLGSRTYSFLATCQARYL